MISRPFLSLNFIHRRSELLPLQQNSSSFQSISCSLLPQEELIWTPSLSRVGNCVPLPSRLCIFDLCVAVIILLPSLHQLIFIPITKCNNKSLDGAYEKHRQSFGESTTVISTVRSWLAKRSNGILKYLTCFLNSRLFLFTLILLARFKDSFTIRE